MSGSFSLSLAWTVMVVRDHYERTWARAGVPQVER